jgi:hypothetical protein
MTKNSTPNGSRARAPACEDLESLDNFAFASDSARSAALRNAHRLCLMALNRIRTWAKDGVVHDAMEPDIPSAIKCVELATRLQGLMPEGGKSAGKSQTDDPQTGPEVEKQLYAFIQRTWPGQKWPSLEELKGKRG